MVLITNFLHHTLLTTDMTLITRRYTDILEGLNHLDCSLRYLGPDIVSKIVKFTEEMEQAEKHYLCVEDLRINHGYILKPLHSSSCLASLSRIVEVSCYCSFTGIFEALPRAGYFVHELHDAYTAICRRKVKIKITSYSITRVRVEIQKYGYVFTYDHALDSHGMMDPDIYLDTCKELMSVKHTSLYDLDEDDFFNLRVDWWEPIERQRLNDLADDSSDEGYISVGTEDMEYGRETTGADYLDDFTYAALGLYNYDAAP